MKKVVVDTKSIQDAKLKMLDKVNDLKKMLDKTVQKVEESKKDFDTPVANIFRTKVDEYVISEKKELDTGLISLIKSLDNITKAYDEMNETFKKEVDS